MSNKRPRTLPQYELLYHPSIPGRGEFIRLALEAAGAPYTDVANAQKDGYSTVQSICITNTSPSSADGNPPIFAPPALRITSEKEGSTTKPLIISQTPNILSYLGDKLGLVPEDDEDGAGKYHVAQVALTALDLNNEVHDTHHPIASSAYYEDQKEESLKKAKDVRENRLPKYFVYFQRVLQGNKKEGKGKYLVGEGLTYADTTVWQVLDGLYYAFPKEMEARRKEFSELLEGFYGSVKEEERLKSYLASERRRPYSMGVFRHYPELDRQ